MPTGDKSKFKHVDHPNFEVHDFQSLADITGYSATGLASLYSRGIFPLLATNFRKSKNCFAITKDVIARLRERKHENEYSRRPIVSR